MKFTAALLAGGLFSTSVLGHGMPALSQTEIQRRSAISKRCEHAAGNLNRKRHEKRMAKRWDGATRNSSVVITSEAPYYETIQNDTCVLTPDVTEGPYIWPRSQTLRQDMSEDQAGIPLWLDIGVLDMATCEPLENVLVSFWHCNATGSYSSFTGLDPNTDFVTLLGQLGYNVSDFEIGTTDLHTDDTTFLRGMWPTDQDGLLEMKTVFPGFYTGRAIHIHTMVYKDWVLHDNGTLTTGSLVNVGQLFINETISQTIMAQEPYSSHTQINRTTNDEDSIIAQASAGGFSPVLSIVAADGEDITKGMIGYVTMGVDLNDNNATAASHQM
ncbi:hypothetical protein M426DRAFT_66087 [Hypoxylon sp. CI-4A]|nr:hypothetical protein M426DRAFT_66087 [Hypoxylon sp. CI-4A]